MFDPDINKDEIYSISQLNALTREVIEHHFPRVWVEGEISNFARPASGHMYFTLKDAAAQVRCAMFRMKNKQLRFTPKDGIRILAHVKVGFYEARGEFQLLIEHMEETGDGALQRKFEQLKQKLADEGLFDQSGKKQIPAFPKRLGVITSPTGAAIQDVLSVLKRRFPGLPVIIYPVPVQGDQAARSITETIILANQRKDCDILLVTRGGGSLEDLWAFNDEDLARAICASVIPIVAGIGHEIDFTIADFAADIRAPTPSAAAELISPNRQEWLDTLTLLHTRLYRHVSQNIKQNQQLLDWLSKRLKHPSQRLAALAQKIDELEQRLVSNQRHQTRHYFAQLETIKAILKQYSPLLSIKSLNLQNKALSNRLLNAIRNRLDQKQHQFTLQTRALESISPLATLSRGYAIVKRKTDQKILRDSNETEKGAQIIAQLHKGHILCTVDEIKKD